MADDKESIRIRLEPELRAKWQGVLDARKISQQKAVTAMIGWLVEQDPLMQTMLFDQVPETDKAELAKMVLKRLSSRRK
jgi:hypothetical protein